MSDNHRRVVRSRPEAAIVAFVGDAGVGRPIAQPPFDDPLVGGIGVGAGRATSARCTSGMPNRSGIGAISYRNTTYPAMSLWELREIRRKLGENGAAQVDEAAILAAYAPLREHETRAITETKRARRARVRRPVAQPAMLSSAPLESPLQSVTEDIVPFAIEDFS